MDKLKAPKSSKKISQVLSKYSNERFERKTKGGKKKKEPRQQRKEKERAEIKAIEKAVADLAPPSGTLPGASGSASVEKFVDLPISEKTKKALTTAKYTKLTDIQKAAIPHALVGRDILGAAKTGSGKTLAFLIPVLEKLYRLGWSNMDGLGALIISPTRELALQIFDILRKIGIEHSFSAGLAIGGKDVEGEKERIFRMNIIVCTPGRLLHHMDQTPGFDPSNLQVLVLDEADRILDLGFERTLNAILDNLPKERQTLLFSATQTKSVKDLARLSLSHPEFISVHEEAASSTPEQLSQAYMVLPAQDKINVLFSFVKTHLKTKTIIFMSSCKQVAFMYDLFCRLRPGIPILAINGRMKQIKRLEVFKDFCGKQRALLFTTDVSARGLDFPSVDWVVQYDCPEDVQTYIHRVGRTARYKSGGKSLLLLLPSEMKMFDLLTEAKVPLKQIKNNPERTLDVTNKVNGEVIQDSEFKARATKAFKTYLRSVYMQSNKEVFDVSKIPLNELATSMGLSAAPKVKFAKGSVKGLKNMNRELLHMLTLEKQDAQIKKALGSSEEVEISSGKGNILLGDEDSEGEESGDEELLEAKGVLAPLDSEEEAELAAEMSKRKKTKKGKKAAESEGRPLFWEEAMANEKKKDLLGDDEDEEEDSDSEEEMPAAPTTKKSAAPTPKKTAAVAAAASKKRKVVEEEKEESDEEDQSEEEDATPSPPQPPAKKQKTAPAAAKKSTVAKKARTLEEDEELALKLIGGL